MSKDYSEAALNSFIDLLSSKALMNRETLRSRRMAAERLMTVLDNEERLDLSTLDIDHLATRFGNQHADSHPRTLQDYQQRFKSLLTDFFAWREDPVNFKPSTATRMPRRRKGNSTVAPGKPAEGRGNQAKTSHGDDQPPPDSDKLLTVPVSLRPGLVVQLVNVPVDLSGTEAERISNIIKAYAVSSHANN